MPMATTATILGMSRSRFFTILLIVLVAGFIIIKLRPYIAYVSSLVELVRTLFDTSVTLAADTSKGVIDKAAVGTDVIVDKLSGSSRKTIRLPEPIDSSKAEQTPWKSESKTEKTEKQTAEEPDPITEKKRSPEPDDSTSSVQTKSGYCHVGDWKGVRSCVKVKGGCSKGKLYTSETSCTKAVI